VIPEASPTSTSSSVGRSVAIVDRTPASCNLGPRDLPPRVTPRSGGGGVHREDGRHALEVGHWTTTVLGPGGPSIRMETGGWPVP
jgi:hypothetical protein